MNRTLLVVGGAILLFGAGAVVFLLFLPGEGATPGPGYVAPPPLDPGSVNLGPAPGELPPRAVAAPTGPPPPPVYGEPRPVAAEGTWEAVPPAARPTALGAIGGPLGRELIELRPEIDACFDEDAQARHGQAPVSRTQDYAPMDDAGTPVLMLHLETQPGGIRIVDAPVEVQGTASDGLVACAQRVLRGRVIPFPGAKPGARHRLVYALTQ